MKIYNTKHKLPKLLPVDEKKRRYQISSKLCFVWWKWVNSKDQVIDDDNPRMATMFKNNYWVINGVSGQTRIIAWAYVPKLNLDELENSKFINL